MLKCVPGSSLDAILLVALAAGAGAQAAEIQGVTRGVDRRPLPDVQILIHGVAELDDRTLVSDGQGHFSVLHLRAGVFELTATKDGFSEAPKTVVEIGDASSVPVELTLDQEPPAPQAADQSPPRRAMDEPLDGIYPSSDYL